MGVEVARAALRWAGAVVAIVNGLNLALVYVGSLYAWPAAATFGTVSLAEGAAFLVLAGGMDYTASVFPSKVRQHLLKSGEEWSAERHRRTQSNALKYLVVGAVLLVEALVVPVVLR